jgi:hypothetical protein
MTYRNCYFASIYLIIGDVKYIQLSNNESKAVPVTGRGGP